MASGSLYKCWPRGGSPEWVALEAKVGNTRGAALMALRKPTGTGCAHQGQPTRRALLSQPAARRCAVDRVTATTLDQASRSSGCQSFM